MTCHQQLDKTRWPEFHALIDGQSASRVGPQSADWGGALERDKETLRNFMRVTHRRDRVRAFAWGMVAGAVLAWTVTAVCVVYMG